MTVKIRGNCSDSINRAVLERIEHNITSYIVQSSTPNSDIIISFSKIWGS